MADSTGIANLTGEGRKKGTYATWEAAHVRRERVLELVAEGYSPADACRAVGVLPQRISDWRKQYPEWGSRLERVKDSPREVIEESRRDGFTVFRRRHFGHDSPAFHLQAIDAYENTPPGKITINLFPPEHGKTTLFEDYASMKLAHDPLFRFLVAFGKQRTAQKSLARVMKRMEREASEYVQGFGPFRPQSGSGRGRAMEQPWSTQYFTVYKRFIDEDADERDFSMEAVGIGSNILSARTDLLAIDDPQSRKQLGQTDSIEEIVRQDWFTRSRRTRTVMNGSRQGPDDIWERLENALPPTILQIIRYPAIVTDPITGEERPLWPELYSMEQLADTRKVVGEEAWARNYMQKRGNIGKNQAFPERIVEQCKDAERSLEDVPTPGTRLVITLDPALGGKNAVMCLEPTSERLVVRAIREAVGLESNSQIIHEVDLQHGQVTAGGAVVTDLIIESMNFQKGLARDRELEALSISHGYQVSEHLTGWNKYDDDSGVAAMAYSFRKKEIVLPWAADEETRMWVGQLCAQLDAWRPFVRGNKLRQDLVMALWFGWLWWRANFAGVEQGSSWKRETSPYSLTPIRPRLLVPIGARPWAS